MAEKSWPHWSISFGQTSWNTLMHFHGWKVMATLKRDTFILGILQVFSISMAEKSWPHWSNNWLQVDGWWRVMISMAEKSWPHWSVATFRLPLWLSTIFPWLKSHGHIEASPQPQVTLVSGRSFPWLKSHGPIFLYLYQNFISDIKNKYLYQ